MFYNKNEKFNLGEQAFAVRPKKEVQTQIVWKEDDEEVIAETNIIKSAEKMSKSEKTDDGKVVARFDSPEAVADPSGTNVNAYPEVVEDGPEGTGQQRWNLRSLRVIAGGNPGTAHHS